MDPFIVLGLDGVEPDLRAILETQKRIPGVWGEKIGDDVLWNGAREQLSIGFPKQFVDLKHGDTKERLKRIVAGYALLPHPPALLTISGELNDTKTYKKIVAVRGKVGIILTGPLSDWSDKFCWEKYSMSAADWMMHVILHAHKSGAQGVTCPAWLLEEKTVSSLINTVRKKKEFMVVATGIRSKGVPKGNHKYPRTPAFAMKHGATLIVVESEVTGAPGREPLDRLWNIYNSVVAGASA